MDQRLLELEIEIRELKERVGSLEQRLSFDERVKIPMDRKEGQPNKVPSVKRSIIPRRAKSKQKSSTRVGISEAR